MTDQAREYARDMLLRGVPVIRVKPGLKEPFDYLTKPIRDIGTFDRVWASPVFNSGLCMGAGVGTTLVAIDIDMDAAKGKDGLASLKEAGIDIFSYGTWWQRTPRGGYHFIFETDGELLSNRKQRGVMRGVDVRGYHGFVVGPGSVNGTGGAYEPYFMDMPFEPLPAELRAFCETPAERDPAAGIPLVSETGVEIEQARTYLRQDAPLAIEGEGGDNTTYAVACWIRDIGVSQEQALGLLAQEYNAAKCEPPWADDDLRRIVSSAYRNAQNRQGCKSPRLQFDDIDSITSPILRDNGSIDWKAAESHLPDEVFRQDVLDRFPQIADEHGGSPSAILVACLAKLSAMCPHTWRADFGHGCIPLSTFVGIVGAPGKGKGLVQKAANALLPDHIGASGLRTIIVPTGEALIDSYFENIGQPGKKHKMVQVRHNLYAYHTEGGWFQATQNAASKTIWFIARQLWSDEHAGGDRVSRAAGTLSPGSYHIGLSLSFQEDNAMHLLTDDAGGTPQRFLYTNPYWHYRAQFAPKRTTISEHFEKLLAEEQAFREMLSVDDGTEGAFDDLPLTLFEPEDDVRAAYIEEGRVYHEAEGGDTFEAHARGVKVRVSTLLAILRGRKVVTMEDWSAAGAVWDTSLNIANALLRRGKEEKRKLRLAEDMARAEGAISAMNRQSEREAALDAAVKAAADIARKSGAQGVSARDLAMGSNGKRRAKIGHNATGVIIAEAMKRGLIVERDGRYFSS